MLENKIVATPIKKIKRALWLAGLALLCLYLGSVLYDQLLVRFIEMIYNGHSSGFLNRFLSHRSDHPLKFYTNKYRALFLYDLAFVLVIACGCLITGFNFKKMAQATLEFFKAETHPLNLAIFRIVFFLCMLFLTDIPSSLWFGGLPPELRVPVRGAGWLFHYLPTDPAFTVKMAALFLFFCFTGCIGLLSRTSAWIVCISGLYVLGVPQFYGKVNHNHHLLWVAAILAVSPCGDALSCDALIRAWKQTRLGNFRPAEASSAYALPLRFIWLLFGIVYFFPGFWKFMAWSEWVLSDNFKYILYSKWTELGGWTPFFRIDHHPFLCKLSAVSGLCFELSFIFLIFSDRFRPLAAWGGLAFHNVTNLLMKISFLEMQVLYVAFFDWQSIFRRLGRWFFKEVLFVLYDGNCRLCRGTIASLRVFDILGQVVYVNSLDSAEVKKNGLDWLSAQAMAEDMHAVVGKHAWKGYESYRALAMRIPLFWPFLPLMWLWPVPFIGRKIYRRVADSRRCAITEKAPASLWGRSRFLPLFTVGTLLLCANIFCGFDKIVAGWPFACYPTFDGVLSNDEKSGLAVEAWTSDGKAMTVSLDGLIKKFSSERFWGLVENILSIKDENEKQLRLRSFWKVCTKNDPELGKASAVRFYREKLSTTPERWHENPLHRELLYEMHV